MITVIEPKNKNKIDFNTMIEIIYYIKEEFKLKHKCFIYMGGSLVYKGIKDFTNDLDISVSDTDYRNIKNILIERGFDIKEYKKKMGNKGFKLFYKNHEIEIFEEKLNKFAHYLYCIGYKSNYDNMVYFQKLYEIIKMKRRLNRMKDIADIGLIKKYIEDEFYKKYGEKRNYKDMDFMDLFTL